MSALESSVTLEDVFTVVSAKRVPLAPELAGYLTLEIAEGADPQGGAVDPRAVFIGEEGTVALVKARREAPTGDAETSVRGILAKLLEASGSQTPSLAASAKKKPGAGLAPLAEELEAALIPVNRAAGRRALARLAREVKRVTLGVGRNATAAPPPSMRPSYPSEPKEPTPPPPAPARREPTPAPPPARREPTPRPPNADASFSPEEERTALRASIPPELVEEEVSIPTPSIPIVEPTDPPAKTTDAVDDLIASFGVSSGARTEQAARRDLKAMIGLEPTPPPPPAASPPSDDVEVLLSMSKPTSAAAREPSPAPGPVAPAVRASAASFPDATPEPPRSAKDDRQLPTGPSKLRTSQVAPAKKKSGPGATLYVVVAAAALVVGTVAVWQLRPSLFSKTPDNHKVEPDKRTAAPANTSACRATLLVTDVPAHAEVLLRVGQAPVDVDKMPVGARLEFVATAEGHAPKRAVVPSGASWEPRDGKPRFELSVQLEPSKAKPGTVDLWPAGEPGIQVGGNGPPGTVHVVTNPKGAEVWELAGIGPEARIENLRCDADVEVLVAGPTTLRKRLRVGAADFIRQDADPKGGHRLGRVSAK
jgi:hypothetical protein